ARETSVFFATFRYTPFSRAFLRRSVNCETVKPRYSAATSECADAATPASSATTSFFWFRFRAIALPLLLLFRPVASAPGRAMAASIPRCGERLAAFRLAAVSKHHRHASNDSGGSATIYAGPFVLSHSGIKRSGRQRRRIHAIP